MATEVQSRHCCRLQCATNDTACQNNMQPLWRTGVADCPLCRELLQPWHCYPAAARLPLGHPTRAASIVRGTRLRHQLEVCTLTPPRLHHPRQHHQVHHCANEYTLLRGNRRINDAVAFTAACATPTPKEGGAGFHDRAPTNRSLHGTSYHQAIPSYLPNGTGYIYMTPAGSDSARGKPQQLENQIARTRQVLERLHPVARCFTTLRQSQAAGQGGLGDGARRRIPRRTSGRQDL